MMNKLKSTSGETIAEVLVASLVVVLEGLAVLIHIGYVYKAGAYAGALVNEGYGVVAVGLYRAARFAFGADKLIVIEDAAVGKSAVGAALSVLRGLRLEDRAAVGNMVDRE